MHINRDNPLPIRHRIVHLISVIFFTSLLTVHGAATTPCEIKEPTTQGIQAAIPHDFGRWEKEITAFEAADRTSPPPKGAVLFIGSSTIRLWKSLAEDFPEYPVINRGFGGSEIADSTHFADRIIFPYEPKQVFLRAGGNDIHAGRPPDEVAADFADFVGKVHAHLPKTEIGYIAVNPAPARWGENDKYRDLNKKIRKLALSMPQVSFVDTYDISLTPDGHTRPELFIADKLHFNADGYQLLADRVRPYLSVSSAWPALQAKNPMSPTAIVRPNHIRNVCVYNQAGRFGGWPANHGIWSWGNEILVGFSAAWYQRQNPEVHQYDRSKPEEPQLARSLDGGLSWTIEAPPSLRPPEQGGKAVTDLQEAMDFTAPGFAMTLRLTNVNTGPARLYSSMDRGHTWQGPFSFPLFGQKGVAARTDYIILGSREAIVFLTASKSNGKEGRPFAARTTDGGLQWEFLSWIGPEPTGFAIMPSSLQLGANEFLVAVRCKEGQRDWIDLYHSAYGARMWEWRSRIAETNSGKSGNPPSMVRLAEGLVAITYGRRAEPFGIAARISSDQGKTWGEEIALRDDGAAWDLGYPRTVVRPDGTIVTVYYFAGAADKERTIEATLWRPPSPGLRLERVFGPEIRNTGVYKHPASIAELANGDLYIVWYGGEGEYAVTTAVWGTRLRRGESRWSDPKPIARDPLRSLGNAVIWQAPDGAVWLFYVVRHGLTWSDSRIQGKISHDNCETWSDAFVVSEQQGMMVRGRPLELGNGLFLLPVYHETGHDTEMVGAESTSLFLRFDSTKRTFTPSAPIRSKNGNIQPAVVALDANHLLAYCRRGGGYGPGWKGYIVQAESTDGGLTWSEGQNSQFPNPNAAVDFLKLANGNLLLIFNDSMVDRTPLTLTLSKDGGCSWPIRVNLAEGPYDYAYPCAIQGRDGNIHVVYTSHGRTVVNRAIIREGWIEGHSMSVRKDP